MRYLRITIIAWLAMAGMGMVSSGFTPGGMPVSSAGLEETAIRRNSNGNRDCLYLRNSDSEQINERENEENEDGNEPHADLCHNAVIQVFVFLARSPARLPFESRFYSCSIILAGMFFRL